MKKESWISPCEKVNLHPHRRIPIDEWLKKIDAKIQTGERFFKERDNNLFDAMPAVWRNLSVESRHAVVSTIDDFIGNTPKGKMAWSTANSRKLMKYCSLNDIPKMRASYMMAKIDPEVIVGIDTKTQVEATAERRVNRFVDRICLGNPPPLHYVVRGQRTSPIRGNLFLVSMGAS